MNFSSLCILAYKRPDMLKQCLQSLYDTLDSPCEIIINLDGGDGENLTYLTDQLSQGKISKLIVSAGQNRGVGVSFQNCIGISEGDYIFKIDSDLIFKPQWLSTAVRILDQHPEIGAISLFNYRHYDANDTRFETQLRFADFSTVNDFVSSIYGFRRSDLSKICPVQDDGNHTKLGLLAITNEDLCSNVGFGLKSVYVTFKPDGSASKTVTYNEPLLFPK